VKDAPQVLIRLAHWETDGAALLSIRRFVFVIEQSVPEELEVDGEDPACHHVVAEAGGRAVGTARMMDDGHIGRVAVLREYRSTGIGTGLMRALLAHGQSLGLTRYYLHGQVSALAFYENLGFVAEGTVFEEAGIPHRCMVLG
jgi:predicted GNAT family N-acyltransferase